MDDSIYEIHSGDDFPQKKVHHKAKKAITQELSMTNALAIGCFILLIIMLGLIVTRILGKNRNNQLSNASQEINSKNKVVPKTPTLSVEKNCSASEAASQNFNCTEIESTNTNEPTNDVQINTTKTPSPHSSQVVALNRVTISPSPSLSFVSGNQNANVNSGLNQSGNPNQNTSQNTSSSAGNNNQYITPSTSPTFTPSPTPDIPPNITEIVDNKNSLNGSILDVIGFLIHGHIGAEACTYGGICDYSEIYLNQEPGWDRDQNYDVVVHMNANEIEDYYKEGEKIILKARVNILEDGSILLTKIYN